MRGLARVGGDESLIPILVVYDNAYSRNNGHSRSSSVRDAIERRDRNVSSTKFASLPVATEICEDAAIWASSGLKHVVSERDRAICDGCLDFVPSSGIELPACEKGFFKFEPCCQGCVASVIYTLSRNLVVHVEKVL